MPRSLLLLPALLALSACNQPDKTRVAVPAAPVEAGQRPKVSSAPEVPPDPELALRASGGTFEATAGIFEQLPASELPVPPQKDSPALASQSRVRRDGPRLLFTLDDGRQTELKDVDSDDDSVTIHYYWGALPTAHQWVVQVGLWEGSAVALIDQRSGRVKYVWGQPYVSPDGHHVLTTSADLEAGYNANGVQLFRVQADSLRLLGEREFKDQGPEQARWLNNHAVVLEMQGIHLGEGPFPSTYLGLDLAETPATARR